MQVKEERLLEIFEQANRVYDVCSELCSKTEKEDERECISKNKNIKGNAQCPTKKLRRVTFQKYHSIFND